MSQRSQPRALENLGDVISDSAVRTLFHRFAADLSHLHANLDLRVTETELHASFNGRQVCRVVPYRELLHVQAGDRPLWETRVRSESDYWDAFDRVLEGLLRWAGAPD